MSYIYVQLNDFQHDQRITGLDWSPEGDRLLSCSSDRNAYVWSHENGQWRPSLVLLRFKRAATCAQWSADGKKFAVGGSEGLVAIGHFDAANDWWVCKHLKKTISGPVLSLAWHPNGRMVAVGTLEGKLMLTSAFIPEVDSTEKGLSWVDQAALKSFDTECLSVEVGSWILAIAFSPSGNALAWSSQEAIISLYYPASGFQSTVQCLTKDAKIPYNQLLFMSENVLLAAGSNADPIILAGADGKEWKLKQELEAAASSKKGSSVAANIAARFQRMDQQGQSGEELDKKTAGQSPHISSISSIQNAGKHIATTGYDGRVVFWSLDALASQLEMEAARL
jgi:actin related protein 2/3 complex subunit 1A/1B